MSDIEEPVLATYHVLADIEAERFRQMSAEGWTAEHDDSHTDNQLSRAAACYAIGNIGYWPWDLDWWKPPISSSRCGRNSKRPVNAIYSRMNGQTAQLRMQQRLGKR
jgi:hypothetical protein